MKKAADVEADLHRTIEDEEKKLKSLELDMERQKNEYQVRLLLEDAFYAVFLQRCSHQTKICTLITHMLYDLGLFDNTNSVKNITV